MHIAPRHLRWYAAYHNKDKNPHVHMLVWSDRPREAYLDKTGIHNIKKTMAGDISVRRITVFIKSRPSIVIISVRASVNG